MEINHFGHLAQKDIPVTSPLLYMRNPEPGGDGEVQNQLNTIEKHYQIQAEMLNQQFEEQRRLLAHEQQVKMQEYIKVHMVMLQKQQQELYEQQKKMQEQQIQQEMMVHEKMEMIKNKTPADQSAIASNEVKAKLRECLLNKNPNHLKNSPPNFRHWAAHHSSLEQHSPPTSGLSPPLRPHLLGKYGDEYPLRKTVSEPNLKMRSKMSLRVIQGHRSSPLIPRRGVPGVKKKLHLTIDTTPCSSNPDSGPNTPPSSSHGSLGETTPHGSLDRQESTALPLQMISKMVINQSMPNISIGQPRDKSKARDSPVSAVSMNSPEAELRAKMAAQYGMPLTMGSTGSIPFYQFAPVGDCEIPPTSPAYVEAQMRALESARSTGQLPLSPGMPPGMPYTIANNVIGMAEAQAAQARLQRPPLNRTHSSPLPIGPMPAQLLLQHQLLLQKQQEQYIKENQKHYLKQRLQSTLTQRALSKNHMENVDEEAEARLAQDMKEIREKEDSDVVIIDEAEKSEPERAPRVSKEREAFLLKMRHRTVSAGSPPVMMAASKPSLNRAQSSPVVLHGYPSQSSPPVEGAAKVTYTTGLAYDTLMLKHQCCCGDNVTHPEHPGRLQSIYARLLETGLVGRCDKVKSRKATLEELQTCHSEHYTLLYGSSPDKIDPKVLSYMNVPRVRMVCGGIGVDSDTVWNDTFTPQAARMAAGCVIELAFKVATGGLNNGFAIVRPPGHHAEPTQPMGFCYFNSIAVATKLLLNQLHMKKILLLDWDVHHGNSTQQIFYADPRVLYLSLHRHDNGNFFPGTGAPGECGIDRGTGFNVNVAFSGSLNPPMSDAEYMAAFRTIVMPIAREFQPEIVLVSSGFDGAKGHPAPMGGYNLSAQLFGHMTQQLMTLANGKVVLVLEGGYELKAICDASEICLRALLGDEIPMLSEEEMCRTPDPCAIETLENTIKYQAPYWPCVTRYTSTLNWSLVDTQQRDVDEADTVSAFASLSVVPEKSPSEHSEPSSERVHTHEEPMEES